MENEPNKKESAGPSPSGDTGASFKLEIIIFSVLLVAFAILGGLLGFNRMQGIWPYLLIIALVIGGLIATYRAKKRMERGLGRKIRGDYELSSINSWMQVVEKEGASSDDAPLPVAGQSETAQPKEQDFRTSYSSHERNR